MGNILEIFCEGVSEPIGMDNKYPQFSWKIKACDGIKKQTRYSVYVAKHQSAFENPMQLCGVMENISDANTVRYEGKKLCSSQKYYWKVVLEYDHQTIIESEIHSFETGFLNYSDWKAKWITASFVRIEKELPPIQENGNGAYVPLEDMKLGKVWRFRKAFTVEKKKVKQARLYATAHGIYIPILDGEKVGNIELAPGFSEYRNRLAYQVYDVTNQLSVGTHVIGAVLADGWYAGHMGFYGENCAYGDQLGLLMQLHVYYEDGTRDIVVSDETFQAEKSAYEYGDLMVGEKLVASNISSDFWEKETYKTGHALVIDHVNQKLFSEYQNPIKVLEEIEPVAMLKKGEEEWLIDFGQCIAGKVRIKLQEKNGKQIQLEHTEVLGLSGNFMRNIREPYKNQIDIYVCSGKSDEVYEPMLTYHGFRYVKVSGITKELKKNDISAIVIGSKMQTTGAFECSDVRLNQLQKNILRSQKSNMVSIPTDCPQREKTGWTGDVQVYGGTACFNQDIKVFFEKWLGDVRFSQRDDGQIPIIVPWNKGFERAFEGISSATGWSDVIITLPLELYQEYGDIKVLEENYHAMENWMEYLRITGETKNPEEFCINNAEEAEHLKYAINTGFHFGDWLTPSVSVNIETGEVEMMQSAIRTMEIVPTIIFALSCKKMISISKVLEKENRVEYYKKLYQNIKMAFEYLFIDEQKNLKSDLQGVHVLTLEAGLVDGHTKKNVERALVRLIMNNQNRLDTGFLSTPFLLDILARIGEERLAEQVLMNEECPSWLYEIKKGATSIWESWQGIFPNGKCGYLSMNHYAFGCVGSFLYHYYGGISALEPGYKKILFSPKWNGRLNEVTVEHESIFGTVACSWKRCNKKLDIQLTVPANTTAVLELQDLNIYIAVEPGNHSFQFDTIE